MPGLGPFESYAQPGVYPTTVIAEDEAANTQGTRLPILVGPAAEEIEVWNFNTFRGSSAVLDNHIYAEDLAPQITGTNRNFFLGSTPVVTGDGTGTVTNDPTKVEILMNGEKVTVTNLNGVTGEIWIAALPQPGDTLTAAYYYNRTDTLITNENLSIQADGSAVVFKTSYKPIVVGDNGGTTTTDVTKVTVTVNSIPTVPVSLDGANGTFTLAVAPAPSATVLITYYTNMWQNTWDLLPNTVSSVIQVGNYPDRLDYFENQDFVVFEDKIFWGTTAYTKADTNNTLAGSTPFDDSYIQLVQYDNQIFYEVIGVGNGVSKSFYLTYLPVNGSGLDVPTDDPSLVEVRVGVDIESAVVATPATVTKLNSTTREVVLASAPALGRIVLAKYYHNMMTDDVYSLTATVLGAPPTGQYKVFDSVNRQLRDINPNIGSCVVAAPGFAIEGISWPSAQSDLQTIQGYSPVEIIRCTFQTPSRYLVTSSRSPANMSADGLGRTGNAQTGVPGDAIQASAISGSGISQLTFQALTVGDWANADTGGFTVRLINPLAPGAALSAVRNGTYIDGSLATSPAVNATGGMTVVGFNGGPGTVLEGDTFGIGDGTNFYVFEFDSNGAVSPGHIPVILPPGPSAPAAVHAAMILAINGVPGFGVASAGLSPALVLTGPASVAANVPVIETLTAPATLTPVGMAGGDAGGAITTTAAALAAIFNGAPAIAAIITTVPAGVGIVAPGVYPLAGGNPSCGYLGKTYVDSVTGVQFTVLKPTIFLYAPLDYLVFESKNEFYVKTTPTLAVPGVKTVVGTTLGLAVNNVGLVNTFKKAGNEPDIGDEYYVSYRYPKTDYSLRIHNRLGPVQEEFGSYSLDYPLVVMFSLAQRNGSPFIGLMQVKKAPGTEDGTDQAYIDVLQELEKRQRGNPNIKAIVTHRLTDTVISELKKHTEKMSSQRYRKNRRAIIGQPIGTEPSEVKDLARTLRTDRITLVYPDKWIIGITDALGNELEYLVGGQYLAAMFAGLDVSPTYDVAESMIGKQLVGLKRPARVLNDDEMNDIAPAGVTLVEWTDPLLIVRHDLSTDMTTVLRQQPSVAKIIDYVEEGAESSLDPFKGQKGLERKLGEMQAAYASFLRSSKKLEIIKAWRNVIVNFDSSDPRIVRVVAEYSPVLPIVWIPVENRIRIT